MRIASNVPGRIVGGLLLLLLVAGPACAQRLEIELTPRSAFIGEEVRYDVVIQAGNGAEIEVAPVADEGITLTLVEEGLAGRTIINGRDMSPYVFRYSVTTSRPGRFGITPPRVKLRGRTLSGPRSELEVLDPGAQNDLFVNVSSTPEQVYIGQRVTIRTEIGLALLEAPAPTSDPLAYHDRGRGRLFGGGNDPTAPTIGLPGIPEPPFGSGGFDVNAWLKKNEVGRNERGFILREDGRQRLRLNGAFDDRTIERGGSKRRFRVYRFEHTLVADRAGRFDLGPAEIRGQVPRKGADGQYAWSRAFASSEPFVITIEEPPLATRPKDFGGAVGSFRVTMSDPTPARVRVGDAIYFTLLVEGEGLLDGVTFDLERAFGADFTIEEPKVIESLKPGEARPEGFPDRAGTWKQFDFKVRPRNEALTKLPAFAWSWFDPETERYETANLAARPIEVIAATAGASGVTVATDGEAERQRIDLVAAVLSPNEEDLERLRDQSIRLGTWLGTVVALLPLFVLCALFLRGWRRAHADPALVRQRGAVPRATKVIEQALEEARRGDVSEALPRAFEALRALVADQENRPPSAVTGSDLVQWAARHGAGESVRRAIEGLVDDAEALRFGGGQPPAERVSEEIAETGSFLRETGRSQKKRGGGALPIVLFALVGLAPDSLVAQDMDALARAQMAFRAENFEEAARRFESMQSDGYENGWIWFNAGNAWLRAGEVGHAIAAYRRAEPFLRGDANFRRNLAQALDRRPAVLAGSEETSVEDAVFFWQRGMSLPAQLGVALGLAVLAFLAGMVRVVLTAKLPLVRPVAIVCALLALVFAVGAWRDDARNRSGIRGVLTADTVVVRASLPTSDADDARSPLEAPLRVGTEFPVEGPARDDHAGRSWIPIGLPGGLRGWLPANSVTTW